MLSILDPCVTRVRDNMGLRLWRHPLVLRQARAQTFFYRDLFLLDLCNGPLLKLVLIQSNKWFYSFQTLLKKDQQSAMKRLTFCFKFNSRFDLFHFALKSFLLTVPNLDFLILPSNAKNNHLASSKEFLEMWLKYLAKIFAWLHCSNLVFVSAFILGILASDDISRILLSDNTSRILASRNIDCEL